jgi:iron-sulfur cluster repair protein YtfE (RIC family)
MFDEVERVLPDFQSPAEVGRLARILEGLLRTHGKLETNLAFLPLDHALQHQGRLRVLYHDHREVDEWLRQVHQATTCEEAQRRLRAAIGAAREHFRREEQLVFPVLERTLAEGALAALGDAFERTSTGRLQAGR